MRNLCLLVLVAALAAVRTSAAVDSRHTRERVICVVPIIGAGTTLDPRRPVFAPAPGEAVIIEGFSWTPTDDGENAIVEFVSGSPVALDELVKDRRIVKSFRKGRDKKNDIERELRKFKKDFDFDSFTGGVR